MRVVLTLNLWWIFHMSKTDVLQFVRDYSSQMQDEATISEYYDDVIAELSDRRDWFTDVEMLTSSENQETYTLPSNATKALAVFCDDAQLYETRSDELSAMNPDWRDAVGQPEAFTYDQEDAKTFRIYKKPQEASKDFTFALGRPLGIEFPEYAIITVVNERPTNAQDYLDLTIGLRVLEREFTRDSNHTDLRFAGICRDLAAILEDNM